MGPKWQDPSPKDPKRGLPIFGSLTLGDSQVPPARGRAHGWGRSEARQGRTVASSSLTWFLGAKQHRYGSFYKLGVLFVVGAPVFLETPTFCLCSMWFLRDGTVVPLSAFEPKAAVHVHPAWSSVRLQKAAQYRTCSMYILGFLDTYFGVQSKLLPLSNYCPMVLYQMYASLLAYLLDLLGARLVPARSPAISKGKSQIHLSASKPQTIDSTS